MKTLAFQMTDDQLRIGLTRAVSMVDDNTVSEGVKNVLAEVAIDYEEELVRRASLEAAVIPSWARWSLVPLA